MLQRCARVWSGERRGRLAGTLLLANISLIVVAALWRHAAADDPTPAPATDQAQTDALPGSLPSVDPPQSDAPSATTESAVADDPVMDELRKVIRDPQGGLELPRLDETSPLDLPMESSPAPQSSAEESSVQLEQRLETIHALSTAALALVRESRRLSDAGQASEAAALRRNAADLRRMIASLAASPAGATGVLSH